MQLDFSLPRNARIDSLPPFEMRRKSETKYIKSFNPNLMHLLI